MAAFIGFWGQVQVGRQRTNQAGQQAWHQTANERITVPGGLATRLAWYRGIEGKE